MKVGAHVCLIVRRVYRIYCDVADLRCRKVSRMLVSSCLHLAVVTFVEEIYVIVGQMQELMMLNNC